MVHDIPLLYEMNSDKEEKYVIEPPNFPGGESSFFQELEYVKNAIEEHKKTIGKVKNQMYGINPLLQPCCNILNKCTCDRLDYSKHILNQYGSSLATFK
mmetsp:Transcript_219/g.236  ORF Transcript_219/g.236 Transcript_219/m.236 type:complete len:99 (-) Transcript_219:555-851(-)